MSLYQIYSWTVILCMSYKLLCCILGQSSVFYACLKVNFEQKSGVWCGNLESIGADHIDVPTIIITTIVWFW